MLLGAEIPTVDWLDTLARLGVAAGLGGIVGLERELEEKAAGLRTHMLVSVGSALFTMVGAYGFSDFFVGDTAITRADPSRIAAQVVTGIGFLGAGVIFRHGFTIRGLTTAASLWLVAAIGVAAGAGFWAGAVIATVGALVSLKGLEWVKARMIPASATVQLDVELRDGSGGANVVAALERAGDVHALRRHGARLEVELHVRMADRAAVLDAVAALPEVEEARWRR